MNTQAVIHDVHYLLVHNMNITVLAVVNIIIDMKGNSFIGSVPVNNERFRSISESCYENF